jgi:glutamate/aspartate transport system substrate-binding protein
MRILAAFLMLACTTLAASSQVTVPDGSRLKAITTEQVIKIAYRQDARPFSFESESKEPVGFTIDLCRLIVTDIQRQLGLQSIRIAWVPVTSQTRFSTVAEGKADIECGSSTITLGRMTEVDFSNPIFAETTGIAVRRATGARTFGDLGGRKIGVVQGTTNQRAIEAQLKSRGLSATVVAFDDRAAAAAALDAGQVDAYASDKLLLVGTQYSRADQLFMLPDDLSIEPYGIAVPRGDWALKLAVNAGLAKIYRSGLIAQVFEAWFGRLGFQPGPVVQALYMYGALAD